jgi:O-antigen/teichoic acid export membrane protein
LQLLGVLLVSLAGLGATALVLGWAVPYGFCCVVAVLWLARALSSRGAVAPPSGTAGTLFAEFWRFAAPRGLAGVFAVIVLWLDTLLIGAFRSASEAGIYAAAVRYLAFGAFASQAIVQAIAPTMSRLLTAGEIGVARSVYRAGTAWSMLFGWPVYFLLVIFAPALLSVFGPPYVAGQDALTILATTMLIATAVGPVDVVLLMAGKSGWNLMNTLGALIVNVGLNIALIPRWGIAGAAIAWSVSILTNNLAPLAQLWTFLHLHPFGGETVSVAVAAATSFAVIPLAVRLAFGASVSTFAIASILGLGLYVFLVWRIRDSARLEQLFAMRSRSGFPEHSQRSADSPEPW